MSNRPKILGMCSPKNKTNVPIRKVPIPSVDIQFLGTSRSRKYNTRESAVLVPIHMSEHVSSKEGMKISNSGRRSQAPVSTAGGM